MKDEEKEDPLLMREEKDEPLLMNKGKDDPLLMREEKDEPLLMNKGKDDPLMDDEQIVALYFARDERAVEETALKYGPRLRSLAAWITGDGQTAEECENDTYLEAWNTVPPHDPARYLYAYLARITRHIAIDACRTRDRLKRRGRIAELTAEMEACIPAPSSDTEEKLEAEELGRAVSRWLRTLTEEKRFVFIRRYWYLDPVKTIAARRGIGVGKVKMILLRCRKELRDYLAKEGYEI